MATLVAYRNRHWKRSVKITDTDGNTIPYGQDDIVRVKIGRTGETPILDLSSASASANGSTVEAANPATVEIDYEDIELLSSGTYDITTELWDESEEQLKHACMNIFHVVQTPGGGEGP